MHPGTRDQGRRGSAATAVAFCLAASLARPWVFAKNQGRVRDAARQVTAGHGKEVLSLSFVSDRACARCCLLFGDVSVPAVMSDSSDDDQAGRDARLNRTMLTIY